MAMKHAIIIFFIAISALALGHTDSRKVAEISTSKLVETSATRSAAQPCADQNACAAANKAVYSDIDARHEAILHGAKLISFSWTKGGFETVMILKTVIIKNSSKYDLKDFKLSCTLRGNSGTILGEKSVTIYDIVQHSASRTFKEVNMGFVGPQVSRAGCVLESWSIHDRNK
jgi:hypothetical protein